MPTPAHTRPHAMPPARWVEPRRATRCQERKLQEWRLDGRGDRGTQMAAVPRAVVCQERDNRMTNKTNNSLTPVAHQPGRLPGRTNNSLTPAANQPGRPPVRVKLRRVNANLATAYPPDGESKVWWRRLKKALGTTSSALRQRPPSRGRPATSQRDRWSQGRYMPFARGDDGARTICPPSKGVCLAAQPLAEGPFAEGPSRQAQPRPASWVPQDVPREGP